jgi:hypothetical protein
VITYNKPQQPHPLPETSNPHSPKPLRPSKGVSVSSRVEESLRDGPLIAQQILIPSGRPGSGTLLLTETRGAQRPHRAQRHTRAQHYNPRGAPPLKKPGTKKPSRSN